MILKEGTCRRRPHYRDLNYPGYHVAWSAVTLPPWLPKRFAVKLLNHARTTLVLRFNRIISLIPEEQTLRKRLASVASTGLEFEGEPPYKKRRTAKDKDSLLTLKEQKEKNEKTLTEVKMKVKMTIDNIGNSESDQNVGSEESEEW